jgi:uncharacterized protein (UPF0548 family)
MFSVTRPGDGRLREVHALHRDLPLSYREVGCTSCDCPPGYVRDHYHVELGQGASVFERARLAMSEWRMLQLGWIEPCWPDAPIAPGALVATMANVFGVWAINVCRIVSVIDEDGPVERYGLAYGTLCGHMECGEEQFVVEWNRADDGVCYAIRAVSKPGQWLTRMSYPLIRRLQRRFGHDSMQAMLAAVG